MVTPGYTDQTVSAAGGNPYGTAHPSGSEAPADRVLEAARHQGRRLARIAAGFSAPVLGSAGSQSPQR